MRKLTHMEFGCQPSRHHGEEAFPKLRRKPCRPRALGEYFMTLYDSGRAPTPGVRVRVRVRVQTYAYASSMALLGSTCRAPAPLGALVRINKCQLCTAMSK